MLCTCCDLGVVEDEQHVVLECPAYAEARNDLLNHEEVNMRGIMNGDGSAKHWRSIVRFLRACSERRADIRRRQIALGDIPESMTVDF